MQKAADERAKVVDGKLDEMTAALHQIGELGSKLESLDKKAADADGATVQLQQLVTDVSI